MMAQEIWFRSDLANILISLDSVPVPPGDYAAGWRDALLATGLALGIERRNSPVIRIVPNGQLVDIGTGAALVEVTR